MELYLFIRGLIRTITCTSWFIFMRTTFMLSLDHLVSSLFKTKHRENDCCWCLSVPRKNALQLESQKPMSMSLVCIIFGVVFPQMREHAGKPPLNTKLIYIILHIHLYLCMYIYVCCTPLKIYIYNIPISNTVYQSTSQWKFFNANLQQWRRWLAMYWGVSIDLPLGEGGVAFQTVSSSKWIVADGWKLYPSGN